MICSRHANNKTKHYIFSVKTTMLSMNILNVIWTSDPRPREVDYSQEQMHSIWIYRTFHDLLILGLVKLISLEEQMYSIWTYWTSRGLLILRLLSDHRVCSILTLKLEDEKRLGRVGLLSTGIHTLTTS